ncbi:hypothetical protein [Bacillus weihaiensis]|uniref:DUF4367 domain-containing protein n=1 Tax=Bacillus weihaiensis TaxID=1547283 RepID=A0A1L3MSW0_9BACI|nr:hypothetical protein [Bacillus weihaiensis]APH05438.1 hypothetical protein A9C19_12130 [Bacillus weihaiensis]
MKQKLALLVISIIILVGCNQAVNIVAYDSVQLEKDLKKQAFQHKLPTSLPFKVEDTEITSLPNEQDKQITIDFYGLGTNELGDHLSLSVVNGGEVGKLEGGRKVDLENNEGTYKSEQGEEILSWSEDNLHYRLTYYKEQSDTNVTKEELIEVANSFE